MVSVLWIACRRSVALANALRVAPSERTRSPSEPGRATAFRMGFGPVNVGLWHMAGAVEAEDPDTAVRVEGHTR